MERFRFTEFTTCFIRGQILDRNEVPVDVADLTAATLTLWDIETGSILNGRANLDIKPVGSPPEMNDVTYEANGFFRWDLQPEDNVIVRARRQIERHRATFAFTWDGGNLEYELEIEVANLQKVL